MMVESPTYCGVVWCGVTGQYFQAEVHIHFEYTKKKLDGAPELQHKFSIV